MKRGRHPTGVADKASAGFTIIEAMIVLAVTGLLFVLISTTLAGRQNQAEFTQSINAAREQIQQVISQVQSGYYSNNNDFTCNAHGSSLDFSATGTEMGSNGGCIFLGNVLKFNNTDSIGVYGVAGTQAAQDLSVNQAQPTVIPSNYSSDTIRLEYGLQVVKTYPANGLAAILSSPLNTSAPNATGNTQTDIYTVTNGAAAVPSTTSGVKLKFNVADSIAPSPGRVRICFKSGGTNQYGLVTIGENNRQLSTSLQITDKVNCDL